MNKETIVEIALRRGRTLDPPDLADQAAMAQLAWEAWTPLDRLLELPLEAEEVIDAAAATLGHLADSGHRWHAWRCAEAAAWELARPLPQLPVPLSPGGRRRRGTLRALSAMWRRRRPRKAANRSLKAGGDEAHQGQHRPRTAVGGRRCC